jgi:hypothetical protein
VIQIGEDEIEVIRQEMKERAEILNKRISSHKEENDREDKKGDSYGKGGIRQA